MKTIIVFIEKHSTRYFDASTPELIARACAIILRERHQQGYWFYREYEADVAIFSEEEEQTLQLTDEQIATLPSSLQAQVQRRRNRLRGVRGDYARAKAQEDAFFAALELVLSVPAEEAYKFTTDDIPSFKRSRAISLARELIDIRGDGEYEGYDIMDVE